MQRVLAAALAAQALAKPFVGDFSDLPRGPWSTATPLSGGQTIVDFTPAGINNFYVYEIPVPTTPPPLKAPITVSVTPISGNPNLFIQPGSITNSNPPYSYSATSSTGIDWIQIGVNDTITPTICAQSWGQANTCALWIWVAPGTRATNYTISLDDGSSGSYLNPDVPYIGQVFQGAMGGPAVAGFAFNASLVNGQPTNQVSFTLAPLSGFGRNSVPILAVSITNPTPDINANTTCYVQNTGALSGREVITLTAANAPCWCTQPCTYFVSVTARGSDSTPVVQQQFSLTASQAQYPVTLLQDGVQVSGDGSSAQASTATQLYVFNALFDPVNARAVRVIEVPLVGAVQLFASVDGTVPGPNSPYSATRLSGQNELVIRFTDAPVQAACGVAIANNQTCAITIAAVTTTQRSSYTIQARSASVYELSPGVPIQDYVFPNRVTYYFIRDVNYGGTFEATVTPIANQFVNIYVGSDNVPGTSRPDPNNTATFCYTTQGRTITPGVILIPQGDRCFCYNTSCNYYIGVSTAYNASAEYTVMAKYRGGVQLLTLNTPFTDSLPAVTPTAVNGYIIAYPEGYNRTGAGPASSLTFNVDTVAGAGRLVLNAAICVLGQTCNWTAPWTPQYTYTINSADQNGQIQIQSLDPQFQQYCAATIRTNYNASCAVQFSVTADPLVPTTAVYTLTPFAGSRQLVDGVPINARSPANTFNYFRYTVIDATRPLKITVANLEGNPDVYVGLGFWPNDVNYTFTSQTLGAEVITITWDSPTIQRLNLRFPFDVNIAVLGYEGPAVYDIDATSNGVVQLSVNTPVAGSAGPLGFSYYFFNVPANYTRLQGFRVDVTPITGAQPIILVNTPLGPQSPQGYPAFPRCNGQTCPGTGFANAPFTSLQSFTPNYVEVDPNSPLYAPGTFVVAVYSNLPVTYFITISTIYGIVQLGDGIPFSGSLLAQNYSYFSIVAYDQFDSVLITAQVTDSVRAGIDIVASGNYTIRRPSFGLCGNIPTNTQTLTACGNGVFARNNPGGINNQRTLLSVNSTNMTNAQGGPCNIYPCTLYFGLTERSTIYANAYSNISYTVTANIVKAGASYTILPVGEIQYGVLNSYGTNYYAMSVPIGPNGTTQAMTVTLSPVRQNANIWITLDGSTPSPSNSQYNGTALSGVDYVYISRGSLNRAANYTPGVLIARVAVTVGALPASTTASYYISWTDNDPNAVAAIYAGTPFPDSTGPGTFKYYYFTSLDGTQDLTFSLTMNGGDASLYMSNWGDLANNTNYRPGPGNSCANSTNTGADWIIVPAGPQVGPRVGDPYASQCNCGATPCNYIIAVGCVSRGLCNYVLTAILGDATPLRVTEGQSILLPVAPGRVAYAYFDGSLPLSQNRNVTITASYTGGGNIGNLYLWATNTYFEGASDPSTLPTPANSNSWIWANDPSNGVTPGRQTQNPVIRFGSNDPSVLACNATYCPFITIGITTDAPPGTPPNSVRLNWFSDGGVAQQLALGYASPVQGLQASTGGVNGNIARFTARLNDITQDLVIFVTQNYGRVAISVDPNDPNTVCTVPNGASITCSGVWSAVATTTASGSGQQVSIAISASNPCGSATGYCPSNSSVWRTGQPYYINVVAIADAQFSVTASVNRVPSTLGDSQPFQGVTNSIDQPAFTYTTPTQTISTQYPIAIYVTAPTVPVMVYVNQCPVRSGYNCPSTAALPGPGNAALSQLIPFGTQVITISTGTAFCSAALGTFCRYYFSVYPAGPCDPKAGCNAPFTVMITQQSGAAPIPLLYDSLVDQVTGYSLTLPTKGQLFQVGLDPLAGPATVAVALDSCGPGYPAMYGCNPNEGGCSNNFKPNPGSYNHYAFPAANRGRDFLVMPSVTGVNAVFMQALADPTTPMATPAYEMLLSVRKGYYLGPGTTNGVYGGINLVNVYNSTDIRIDWPAAVIYDTTGTVVGAATGVRYDVYVAVGGFNATQMDPVVNSNCGLRNWLSTAGPGSFRQRNITATNLTVLNLASKAYYEINVIALCDQACFAASLGPNAVEDMRRNMRAVSVSNGRMLQSSNPFQSAFQTAPYYFVNFQTAANNRPQGGGNKPIDPVILGAGIGGGLALCCCVGSIIMLVRRRRRALPKADLTPDQRAARVASIKNMSTTPTPAAANAAAELSAARAERSTFEPVAPGGNVAGWK